MKGDIDSVNHVGAVVRDFDAACARYEAMGFTLTPLSVHSGSTEPGKPVTKMATGNRCAVFPHNYLEIVGFVNPGLPDWGMGTLVDKFQGAQIICFGCGEAEIVDKRLKDSKVKTSGVIALQRDVETADGMKTAKFDCVHFDQSRNPEGLIQAAHHRFPELIHQERYLGHANGALALSDVVVSAPDAKALADKYATYTGRPLEGGDGRWSITLPLVTTLTFVAPDALNEIFPGSLFPAPPCIAGCGYEVADIGTVKAILEKEGLVYQERDGRVVVPAEEACGVATFFKAKAA